MSILELRTLKKKAFIYSRVEVTNEKEGELLTHRQRKG
jgi:hypothetical protein